MQYVQEKVTGQFSRGLNPTEVNRSTICFARFDEKSLNALKLRGLWFVATLYYCKVICHVMFKTYVYI